jgi:hypothetical protein
VELRQISDRLEIADVLTRYTRAIDTRQWDQLDTVFTPDAEIDYTESGGIAASYAEVKPWLAEALPMFFLEWLHTLGQLDIAIDGDTATCTGYFHNPMRMSDGEGGEKVVEVGGLYHHELVRTSDGWRSRKLHEQIAWRRGI